MQSSSIAPYRKAARQTRQIITPEIELFGRNDFAGLSRSTENEIVPGRNPQLRAPSSSCRRRDDTPTTGSDDESLFGLWDPQFGIDRIVHVTGTSDSVWHDDAAPRPQRSPFSALLRRVCAVGALDEAVLKQVCWRCC